MNGSYSKGGASFVRAGNSKLGNEPIRVVLADDYELVRKGIAYSFEADSRLNIQIVGQATNGEEALRLVEALHPDAVLMDLLMPGMGGLSAIKELHERFPEIPILALSSYEEGELVQQALEAGATGYLLKDVGTEGLANAIRMATQGIPTLAPAAAQTLVRKTVKHPPSLGHDLTERERQVLELLVTGLSNQEIAEKLVIMQSTVKFHIRSIRSKIRTKSRTETVVVALNNHLTPATPTQP